MKSSRRRMAFELLEMRRVLAADYFLKLDGIPGESTDARYPGAIELDSFSWGASAGQRSGPASAPSTEEFRFVTSTSKATPKLFEAVSKGTPISNALLYVRNEGNPDLEYLKIKLSDVFVTSVQSQSLNEGVPKEEYSFTFRRIDQTYRPISADGSLGEPISSSWTLPPRSSISPPESGLLSEIKSTNEDQLDAFLKIPGVRGDSQDSAHKDWIHIESFSWGMSQSGQARGGKANFQDIHFVSSIGKASPVLAKAVADGTDLSQAVLHVRRAQSDHVFLKIKLNDVLVTSYHTLGTSDSVPLEEYSFRFGSARQAYYPSSADGTSNATPVIVDLQGRSGEPYRPIKLINKTVAEASQNDFFLKIEGIPGESTNADHKGSIAVESFSWGLSQGSRALGSGGGAGKVNVQDFSFVSKVNSASPLLMASVAAGTKFNAGSLVVRQGGERPYLVYKLEMKDLLVSSYQTKSQNESSPSDRVSLNFAKIKFDYTHQDFSGRPAETTSFQWTVPRTAQFEPNTTDMPDVISGGPGARTRVYLKLDGVDGEATHQDHKGEIEVLSYSWGVSNTSSSRYGGGGGAGKVSLQDFHFVAESGLASSSLIEAAFKGDSSTSGPIARGMLSVRRSDHEPVPAVRYKLSDILVSSYQVSGNNGAAPTEELSLNFAKFEMRYSRQDDRGAVGFVDGRLVSTASMNRERGPSILSSTTQREGTNDYYLKLDGIKGDATHVDHKGEISVDSFSWGVSSSSRGGGAGKVSLQDFHFVMNSSASSPEIVDALRSGELLRDATLVSRTKGQQGGQFIKYEMKEVFITSYRTEGTSGHLQQDEVAVTFKKFEQDYRSNWDGKVSESSMQWQRNGRLVDRQAGDSIIKQTTARTAGTDYFLKLGDIRGDATREGYVNTIELDFVKWETSRNLSPGNGRPIGRPIVSDFEFSVDYGKASPQLMRTLATRNAIDEGWLVVVNDHSPGNIKIELENILVSGYGIVGSDGQDGISNRFRLRPGIDDWAFVPHSPQRMRSFGSDRNELPLADYSAISVEAVDAAHRLLFDESSNEQQAAIATWMAALSTGFLPQISSEQEPLVEDQFTGIVVGDDIKAKSRSLARV